MSGGARLTIPDDLRQPYATLARDLQAVFGPRLEAAVAFGPRIRTLSPQRNTSSPPGDALALVDRVDIDDLVACAGHTSRWQAGGLHVPLLLSRHEFVRSLDAFPLEYDDIIAHHVVLVGDDPFAGVIVRTDDLRRACENRAKGHLVHLREGYLEAHGRPGALADLIVSSASPFVALLGNIARLSGGTPASAERPAGAFADVAGLSTATVARITQLEARPLLSADEAVRLYPDYLGAVERLVARVDEWPRT